MALDSALPRPWPDEAALAPAPRALVVDDERAPLDAASRALRGAGFEVTVAAGGGAALRLLRHTAFDVVLIAGDAADGSARSGPSPVRGVGSLRIDLPGHEVMVGDRAIDVTASEFRVLSLLADSPGRVFTRRQIMEHVWDGPYFGDGHAADTHVLNLRRKIETDPARPRRLLTVRGVGFKLVAPPCELAVGTEP